MRQFFISQGNEVKRTDAQVWAERIEGEQARLRYYELLPERASAEMAEIDAQATILQERLIQLKARMAEREGMMEAIQKSIATMEAKLVEAKASERKATSKTIAADPASLLVLPAWMTPEIITQLKTKGLNPNQIAKAAMSAA